MNFDERLQKAIQRGQQRGEVQARAAQETALSEDELKQLHSRYRLQLSEHIEQCLRRLPGHFPGFQFETIFGERGWGAACSRDDLRLQRGQRDSDYSRLEMTVRPYSSYHVLDLVGKATIRNKEVFNRKYYERLQEADPAKFIEIIDAWVLEFAEMYAAH